MANSGVRCLPIWFVPSLRYWTCHVIGLKDRISLRKRQLGTQWPGSQAAVRFLYGLRFPGFNHSGSIFGSTLGAIAVAGGSTKARSTSPQSTFRSSSPQNHQMPESDLETNSVRAPICQRSRTAAPRSSHTSIAVYTRALQPNWRADTQLHARNGAPNPA